MGAQIHDLATANTHVLFVVLETGFLRSGVPKQARLQANSCIPHPLLLKYAQTIRT